MKPTHFSRARIPVLLLLSVAAWAQPPAKAASDADLERVFHRMDSTASSFRTAEASFAWDQYTKVVDETDTQKGKVYFRRAGNETQMAAEITAPDKKYVLFVGGKVQVYQPNIEQVNEYQAGSNKDAIESFLVLGFGGPGHGLLKTFEVTYAGPETLEGVETDKLDLVPKSPKVRNMFDHIILWIDPRGVSLRQQLIAPSGDYRLAKYSEIQLNDKISDAAFKLKTGGKTQFISH
jgi:outer membrane lipoprotein-sorting protein